MEFKDYSMTSPKIQRLSKTVQTLFDEPFGQDGPPWNYQNTSKIDSWHLTTLALWFYEFGVKG